MHRSDCIRYHKRNRSPPPFSTRLLERENTGERSVALLRVSHSSAVIAKVRSPFVQASQGVSRNTRKTTSHCDSVAGAGAEAAASAAACAAAFALAAFSISSLAIFLTSMSSTFVGDGPAEARAAMRGVKPTAATTDLRVLVLACVASASPWHLEHSHQSETQR